MIDDGLSLVAAHCTGKRRSACVERPDGSLSLRTEDRTCGVSSRVKSWSNVSKWIASGTAMGKTEFSDRVGNHDLAFLLNWFEGLTERVPCSNAGRPSLPTDENDSQVLYLVGS